MRVPLGLLLTCWLPLLILPQRVAAQALTGAIKSPAAQTPDAFAQNKRLGRGVNVLGYDPIWQDRRKARFQEKYFRLIHEAGFNHVRVNLHPFRDAKPAADGRPSAAWFETLDWAVKQALANRLMVVLDFHEFQALDDDPAGNKERFLAVWRRIAEHCKDAPDDVLFEVLNEPNKKLTAKLWNPLLREALTIIRQSDPRRTVIVGPTSWNDIGDLDKLDLPEQDRNLIVTVHYYDPFSFTHQGAAFAGLKDKTGVAWNGTEKEQQAVVKDFDKAQAWAEKHQRPIYLGEFGVYDKAEMAARVRWTSCVARQAEKRQWSWAWWQFDDDFVLYDVRQERWVEPLRQALVPRLVLDVQVRRENFVSIKPGGQSDVQ
jgi:endoglucanase